MSKTLSSVDFKHMLSSLVEIADDPEAEDVLGAWAVGFVHSVNTRVYGYLQGSVMDLSQKQLDKIKELYDKHC